MFTYTLNQAGKKFVTEAIEIEDKLGMHDPDSSKIKVNYLNLPLKTFALKGKTLRNLIASLSNDAMITYAGGEGSESIMIRWYNDNKGQYEGYIITKENDKNAYVLLSEMIDDGVKKADAAREYFSLEAANDVDAYQSKKSDSKKNVTSKALDIFEQCDPIFKEMINIPIGHKYSWDIERQNTWFLNAPGDSLSAYIERESNDDDDPKQYYAEFRIFIGSKRPSGLLFIDYGTRYAGQNKQLIQNHTKIEAESYGYLAHKLSNIFNDILKEHIV